MEERRWAHWISRIDNKNASAANNLSEPSTRSWNTKCSLLPAPKVETIRGYSCRSPQHCLRQPYLTFPCKMQRPYRVSTPVALICPPKYRPRIIRKRRNGIMASTVFSRLSALTRVSHPLTNQQPSASERFSWKPSRKLRSLPAASFVTCNTLLTNYFREITVLAREINNRFNVICWIFSRLSNWRRNFGFSLLRFDN